MNKQYKFHAIAVSAIVLCVILVFALTEAGKKTADEKGQFQQTSDRFVQINSASYGRNCNALIERANDYRKRGNSSARYRNVPKKPIPRNNVIARVSEICNGESTCSFTVSSDALQIDPYQSCVKELEISYRCFSFDRPWTVTAQDRSQLVIDCRDSSQ